MPTLVWAEYEDSEGRLITLSIVEGRSTFYRRREILSMKSYLGYLVRRTLPFPFLFPFLIPRWLFFKWIHFGARHMQVQASTAAGPGSVKNKLGFLTFDLKERPGRDRLLFVLLFVSESYRRRKLATNLAAFALETMDLYVRSERKIRIHSTMGVHSATSRMIGNFWKTVTGQGAWSDSEVVLELKAKYVDATGVERTIVPSEDPGAPS